MDSGAGTGGASDAGEALTVAIVDDELLHRILFRRVLERAFAVRGVRVLEGGTGEEAIALRFGPETPGLLIINGLMPVMDGPEAIAEIRRRELAAGLPRVPILFESSTLPEAPVAGADASLALPTTPADLIAVVAPLVDRSE